MNHPMQPLCRDSKGKIRFHANGIIHRLVDIKAVNLNEIPMWINLYPGITQDDIDQFWQLLGYSVGGYSELAGSDLISNEAADRAEEAAKLIEDQR